MFDKNKEEINLNIECRNPDQTANFIIKELMVNKSEASFLKLLLLGILAGIYIGFGCEIATLATHDTMSFYGFGLTKLLSGAVFSLGLMLVIIAGAELFTGNILIAGSVLEGKVSKKTLFKNWSTVYFANFIGALFLVMLSLYTNLWQQNDFLVGAYALKIGAMKANLTFMEAFTRGILCNWLVCLAVWMAMASRNVIGKIFAIFFPIMTFVALGYEHSIANMFFIPKAIFLSLKPEVMSLANIAPEQLANLNIGGFIKNLIPVTLGNIVGAVIFLAFFYWTAYVRKGKKVSILGKK